MRHQIIIFARFSPRDAKLCQWAIAVHILRADMLRREARNGPRLSIFLRSGSPNWKVSEVKGSYYNKGSVKDSEDLLRRETCEFCFLSLGVTTRLPNDSLTIFTRIIMSSDLIYLPSLKMNLNAGVDDNRYQKSNTRIGNACSACLFDLPRLLHLWLLLR